MRHYREWEKELFGLGTGVVLVHLALGAALMLWIVRMLTA